MNVILRPVFNRPEMLQLSIEYETEARKYFMLSGEYLTIFLVEHGTPQKTLDIINKYPFKHQSIFRTVKFGLSKNILEGMKEVFDIANDHVIYIEDDVLVHKTYFKYLDLLINMSGVGKYSIISPFNQNNNGSVNEVYRGHHYAALAPLITKDFFSRYVKPCISPAYYENFGSRSAFVSTLDKKFASNELYKYRKSIGIHNEQAGLHNRLVDVALIQDGMAVIMPKVNRQIHIGFYGKNRPGGVIPGPDFDSRLKNLRQIITSAEQMYELSATKQYNDYLTWSPKLKEWDGILYVG